MNKLGLAGIVLAATLSGKPTEMRLQEPIPQPKEGQALLYNEPQVESGRTAEGLCYMRIYPSPNSESYVELRDIDLKDVLKRPPLAGANTIHKGSGWLNGQFYTTGENCEGEVYHFEFMRKK